MNFKSEDHLGDDTIDIDRAWPPGDTERLSVCPICEGSGATLAYSAVKDWAFGCAPGSWDYWSCSHCESLYLNPRPTQNSIGRAYGTYYTHSRPSSKLTSLQEFKQKLRNECLFHWLGIENSPRLNFRTPFFLNPLKLIVDRQFPLDQISKLPRGSLLDVGCGNGDLMSSAEAMGFTTQGLEIDPHAVSAASAKGLSVRQGSVDLLKEYPSNFDYVICSHVLEHVHDPRQLTLLLVNSVKPGGRVYLTWPNPQSFILKMFGRHWRGLEAPRHLSLPAKQAFFNLLKENSVSKIEVYSSGFHTFGESWRLRTQTSSFTNRLLNKLIYSLSALMPSFDRQDFLTICFQRHCSSSPMDENLHP
jgi:2-polyprenyl-3-methyl-5-hydroxy-6-metoxy-1,4-benzoquinol methylase